VNAQASPVGPLVLVVEDEAAVRRFLKAGLPAHGYRVIEAETGAAALRDAAQYVPELVLLDLGLPDMDGLEVTKRLRAWSRVPIVVISARGQEAQKVEALDAGADDYLTKPFGFPELLARMRAALRRAAAPEGAGLATVFESGPLRVDLERRRVFVKGDEVKLTPTEYRLLATLVKHAGRVVTHRQLLAEVWGPWSPEQNRYLRVYMTHLRRKLEPDPAAPVLFETEAGVGYRLRDEE
jgi:two-component system, OmpR family, KDP operon response regulator KdpE